jgi:D-specific alpha-keto acid dehydrogenase
MEITAFGCDADEAAVFRARAPYLGIRPVVTDAPVSAGTVALAAGSRCISVGHRSRIGGPQLAALSDAGVRYISTRSIGFDHVDLEVAARVGIRVENVLYSPDSVADHTLLLILMLLRHARAALGRVEAHDYRLGETRGRELHDLTVGVIGTGRIGSAVVERLKGFGCRVVAFDRRQAVRGVDYLPLDALLRTSDVVTLHTPLDAGTVHLLDRDALALMKPDAYLVNTARGGLVDTTALLDALESGRLGGAALDVLEGEDGVFYADRRDRPVGDELLLGLHRHPNVVITPHSAFFTQRALTETVVNSLINCLRFERGLQYD